MKDKKNYFVELIIAILCSFKIINYSLINIFNKSEGGYLDSIFLICMACYIFICLIKLIKLKKEKITNIKISILGTYFIIYTIIIFSFTISKSNLSIVEFLIYFLFAIFLGINEKINIEKLLKYIMFLSLISLLCFDKLFVVQWFGSVNMDISYAFLPTICAAIIHFSYYRRESKNRIIDFVLYIINLFFFWQIVLYGERGTLVCILTLIVLCFAFKPNKNNTILFDKNNTLKLIIIILLMLLVVFFYKDIINVLTDMTGINSYAINKFNTLSNTDISNGRFKLYEKAIEGFLNQPLFGNGISTFDFYYPGYGYPHNLFFQLLFDGGLFLFLPFIYILLHGTVIVFKTKEKSNILLLFYFFAISLLYLTFSNDIWVLPSLWLFVGYLIGMISISKEVNKNESINR